MSPHVNILRLSSGRCNLLSAVRTDQSITAINTERWQQLDAVLHEISGLEIVMDGIKNLHHQLVEQKDKITQFMDLHKGLGSTLWRLPTEVLSHIFVCCLPEDAHLSPAARIRAGPHVRPRALIFVQSRMSLLDKCQHQRKSTTYIAPLAPPSSQPLLELFDGWHTTLSNTGIGAIHSHQTSILAHSGARIPIM
ncbi:uncharacterized protein EDB91DRAFT_1116279 [Suillus paluster]|uniref:uncharacterized protein n=1 Tax=Suillus paluster TaxID=48578 RepID=UPI001B862426|nr:uncharacterized protein EDB91DRAFT_1116279 [Suillus paluster]KAG1747100.1 hypothetical protein EDB91DRAFT_1116279 [Suillus paluster]